MSSSKFDVLAALILSGEATEKQKAEFEEILKVSEEHQVAFDKLKDVWSAHLRHSQEDYWSQKESLWQEFQVQRQSSTGLFWRSPFFKAAAVLLILCLITFLVNQFDDNSEPELIIVENEIIKETNHGEKLKTRLPDGTIVYLNAGSRLVYPENFTDSSRVVQLVGEGYFDVYEDKNRPFTVRIASMDITALGTAFGVNAYNNNLFDQVSLVSGKLLVKNIKNNEIKIDSGQALALSRKDFNFSTSDIDYLAHIAWKDGVLHFKNNSLEEIIKALELNYGVQFKWEEGRFPPRNERYTGTFKNENLENIMKVLSFSMDFKYTINGKEVMIESQ